MYLLPLTTQHIVFRIKVPYSTERVEPHLSIGTVSSIQQSITSSRTTRKSLLKILIIFCFSVATKSVSRPTFTVSPLRSMSKQLVVALIGVTHSLAAEHSPLQ